MFTSIQIEKTVLIAQLCFREYTMFLNKYFALQFAQAPKNAHRKKKKKKN